MAENNEVVVTETATPAVIDVESLSLDVVKTSDFASKYLELKEASDKLAGMKKDIDNKIKSLLNEVYLETGETRVESDGVMFTLVPSRLQDGFDKDKFKADHPRLYAQYVTKSQVSASVRTTVKKK